MRGYETAAQLLAARRLTGATQSGTVYRKSLGHYWVNVDGREWMVDQADPGATTPFEGEVLVQVRPERVHVIPS